MVHLIAEIGINHNGDVGLAKALMSQAKAAGAHSVKFQKRQPEICVPKEMASLPRETPWGTITYLDYKKRLEFGREDYEEIDQFAREIAIPWSASAWDTESLEFLDSFDLPYHKIASAMNTNLDFVEAVARRGKPTIMSTGMTDFEGLDTIVRAFLKIHDDFTLLHCVSTYPAREQDLNLNVMLSLEARYGLPVGYSGHEASVSPSFTAAVLGAKVIERHFTLDRSSWGTDHAASLEPAGFAKLASMIEKIPVVRGDGVKRSVAGEAEVAARLRYWEI